MRYGIVARVKELLVFNSELVHSRDEQGHTCLHWAAKGGDVEMLRVLTAFGADFSSRTTAESGMMPIHWAASDGKILAIKFFLDMRQDINSQDLNGCTPIIIAAQHNQIATVIYLLKCNADVTLKDNFGDGLMHWCGYKGNVELMALLAHTVPSEIENSDCYGQVILFRNSLVHYVHGAHFTLFFKTFHIDPTSSVCDSRKCGLRGVSSKRMPC